MIINNHRKHSSFGLRHYIAGSCYTADAAYCLLYAQREQIEMDVAAGEGAVLSQEAEIMELDFAIKKALELDDKITYLKKKAELIKLNAMLKNFKLNFEGAKRELIELNEILEELKPQCKYWNEDILQMEQDMQHDEWREELKGRAENMMLANVFGIGYDHLATMRQHPDWKKHILPHLDQVAKGITQVRSGQASPQLLENIFIDTLKLDAKIPTSNQLEYKAGSNE